MQELGDKSLDLVSEDKISSNGIKWFIDKTKNHPPFVKLVPLLEIIAEGMESTVTSEKAKEMFDNLCEELDSEINILLKTPIDQIQKIAGTRVAEGIDKVRRGNIVVEPGFDGEYGKVKIWNQSEIVTDNKEYIVKTQLGLGF